MTDVPTSSPTGTPAPLPVISDQPIPGASQSWIFVPALVIATFGTSLTLVATVGTGMAALFARLDPDGKYLGVAAVASIGGVVQTLVTPLAGRLSDRTRARSGMRKPWLLWGSLLALLGTVGVALTPSIAIVIVSVIIAQAGSSIVLMAQHALLAEQVPKERRGLVNGFIGVAQLLSLPATAMVVALAPNLTWVWFVGPGLAGTVFSLLLLVAFRDRVLTERPAPLHWGDVLRSFWINPRTAPDFAWAWAGRFLMFLGLAPLATFWLYYLTDHVRLSAKDAVVVLGQAGLLTTVITAVAGVAAGWISDRTGRRKPLVYLCAAIYVACVVVLLVVPTVGGFWISYGLLLGLASGAFGAVVVALQIDVLPTFEDAGKDLGLVTLSGSLPTIIGPLLATLLLSIGQAPNYAATIVFAIVVLIVAALCFVPIRNVR